MQTAEAYMAEIVAALGLDASDIPGTIAKVVQRALDDALEAAAAKAKALGVRAGWKVGLAFEYGECPEQLADDIAKAIRAMKV